VYQNFTDPHCFHQRFCKWEYNIFRKTFFIPFFRREGAVDPLPRVSLYTSVNESHLLYPHRTTPLLKAGRKIILLNIEYILVCPMFSIPLKTEKIREMTTISPNVIFGFFCYTSAMLREGTQVPYCTLYSR
jgi:hypothetical protein